MKRTFNELTAYKQLSKAAADAACLVELEGQPPMVMSVFQFCMNLQRALHDEFQRCPVGSSIRIMVLTQESEVHND